MSRAFVNEDQIGSTLQSVARPAPSGPNYVTACGLQQLEQRVHALHTALQHELARAEAADAQQLADLQRDLEYYRQRLASAIPAVPAISRDLVQIGSRVAYAMPDGSEHEVQIVGEDEADPVCAKVSWRSPLGRCLLGAAPGEEVTWLRPDGALVIEILEIIPEPH